MAVCVDYKGFSWPSPFKTLSKYIIYLQTSFIKRADTDKLREVFNKVSWARSSCPLALGLTRPLSVSNRPILFRACSCKGVLWGEVDDSQFDS